MLILEDISNLIEESKFKKIGKAIAYSIGPTAATIGVLGTLSGRDIASYQNLEKLKSDVAAPYIGGAVTGSLAGGYLLSRKKKVIKEAAIPHVKKYLKTEFLQNIHPKVLIPGLALTGGVGYLDYHNRYEKNKYIPQIAAAGIGAVGGLTSRYAISKIADKFKKVKADKQ